MRSMHRIACIATILLPLHALPAGAVEAPRPVPPAASTSIALPAGGPPAHLPYLGLLAPGTPQLFLNEPLKAGAYLGGTAALSIGAYYLFRQIYWPESFIPDESHALIILNAVGWSWLAGGALSTLDAYLNLQARQTALESTPRAPNAAPVPAPSAAPSAAPTPGASPIPAPPSPTSRPSPTPLPEPSVTPWGVPSPRPTPTPAPTPDPEAAVYRAYDLAAKGHYLDAVLAIQGIRDPDWLPKAKALLGEWGPKAVDQALTQARARLAEGDPAAARTILERIDSLPRSDAQTRALLNLRQSLR